MQNADGRRQTQRGARVNENGFKPRYEGGDVCTGGNSLWEVVVVVGVATTAPLPFMHLHSCSYPSLATREDASKGASSEYDAALIEPR